MLALFIGSLVLDGRHGVGVAGVVLWCGRQIEWYRIVRYVGKW